jgi:hypothetical protein
MCNLYSLTKGQAAIGDLFRARNDRTGNLPLFPSIFRASILSTIGTKSATLSNSDVKRSRSWATSTSMTAMTR